MKDKDFYLSGEEISGERYHYKNSGLEGIYLLNGFTREFHDGEVHVAIADIDGLHRQIGRHLVLRRKGLSPKEIRFLRKTLNLTQAELADLLGNNSQSVARWEKGECDVPGPSEKLLRVLFMIYTMTDEELASLRASLASLTELDEMDQTSAPPAQFELFGSWSESQAAA